MGVVIGVVMGAVIGVVMGAAMRARIDTTTARRVPRTARSPFHDIARACPIDMHRALPTTSLRRPPPTSVLGTAVVVACTLLALPGCGDLSQEDLVFRAAVPSHADVAVRPPGQQDALDEGVDGGASTTQALSVAQTVDESCLDKDLRCRASTIARGFNGLTFGVLDLIDRILAQPPTRREPGARVWGPVFDPATNRTFRFAMTRVDNATFAFCLHAAVGDVVEQVPDALSCTDSDDAAGGLALLLSGSFSPGNLDDATTRQGAGSMLLEAGRIADLNGERRFARTLETTFDNRDGRTDLHIDVVAAHLDDDSEQDAAYDFVRQPDGSGTFTFDVFANILRPGNGGLTPERVKLDAVWRPDLAGHARGTVSGGDAGTQTYAIEQCWDGTLQTTYFLDVDGQSLGDASSCVLPAPGT